MIRIGFTALAALVAGGMLATPAHAQDPLAPGAQFFWEFNEGSGRITTESNFGYETRVGLASQIVEDHPSGEGTSLWNPGTDGLFASDADDPFLPDLIDGPITAEVWVKVDEHPGNTDFFRYGQTYKFGFRGDGTLLFTHLGIVDIFSTAHIEPGSGWVHVAAVWDPDMEWVLYFINGEEVDVVPVSGFARAPLDNNLWISSSVGANSSQLRGAMSRLRVHNAVLEVDELDVDADNPKPVYDSTVLHYELDSLPAVNQAARPLTATRVRSNPEWVEDSPTGESGDYALYFDGNSLAQFIDEDLIIQFIDEDYTLEAWVKFDIREQNSARPHIISGGVGGQSGYSFSITTGARTVADSPSGQAGDYSSSGAVLGVDVDDSMDISEGPITVECWVKADRFANDWTDLLRYDSTYKVGINQAGNMLFTMLAVEDVHSSAPFPFDGEWHHVAYAWNPGVGVTFYLDGEEVDFVETANTNQARVQNTFSIGSALGGASPFLGLIDRMRVHNAALTADELDTDPANPAAPLDSTVAYFHFDEGGSPYVNQVNADITANALRADRALVMTTYGIADNFSTNAVVPDDGQWHHIAGVHVTGQEMRYYVDGELLDTVAYTGGVRLSEDTRLIFGATTGAGSNYIGWMDRVRITRAALAADDLDYFEPVHVGDWAIY